MKLVFDCQAWFLADASHTLFRFEYLFSMVDVGHDDVLGSDDLSRKWDELKEKCVTLQREIYEVEKELAELQAKDKLVDFLQQDVDRFHSPSSLDAHIMKLKASFSEGEKCWNKASEDVTEACRAFEADQTVLQQNKDDQINSLKSLEEEVIDA